MPRFWFWYVPCMQSWQLREPCISCAVPCMMATRPKAAWPDMEMGEGFECNMGIVHGNFPFQGGDFIYFDSHILGNEATKRWFIIWKSIPHLKFTWEMMKSVQILGPKPGKGSESHPPQTCSQFSDLKGKERMFFFWHPKNPLALCTRLAKEGGDIVISLAAVTLIHTF